MAEQVLEKLEEQLNCSICLDTYTDPKLLQCFHTYCRQCLVPLVDRDQQGQLGLTCPICRQVTPIPGRGVAGLQSAFRINYLLDIQDSFQQFTVPPKATKATRYYFKHPKEDLKLYCETCGELVCIQCIIKGGKHRDHDYALLERAFEGYKEEITSSLELMEKEVAIAEEALASIDSHCREVSDKQATTAENIYGNFRRLRVALDDRETELIGQLHQVAQRQIAVLTRQKEQIETTLAQLHSCLCFMRESLKPGNEADVLMMKSNTVSQVKELTTPFQPDFLKPKAKADMEFLFSSKLTEVCQNYGELVSKDLPSPHQAPITGEDLAISFSIDSHQVDQTYSWSVAGLQLYLPSGPLPEETHEKLIHMKTGIKGSYRFPSNSKPVSTIYNIATDLGVETAIELEHCYRGDLDDLAFVYCDSHQPPFEFRIARRQDFKYSFTPTYGTVRTNHFSYWAIVWLSAGFKGFVNSLVGYQLLKTHSEVIRINAFYCINRSHIRVDLVFLKGLSAHSEVGMVICVHTYILLHDWEGNTWEYLVRGWQYWPEPSSLTRELWFEPHQGLWLLLFSPSFPLFFFFLFPSPSPPNLGHIILWVGQYRGIFSSQVMYCPHQIAI